MISGLQNRSAELASGPGSWSAELSGGPESGGKGGKGGKGKGRKGGGKQGGPAAPGTWMDGQMDITDPAKGPKAPPAPPVVLTPKMIHTMPMKKARAGVPCQSGAYTS